MVIENPGIIPLITPLLIGGIAGLTITCALFTRAFNSIELAAKKCESKNEGTAKIAQMMVDKWEETEEPRLLRYEKWVLLLFGCSILILTVPYLYAVGVGSSITELYQALEYKVISITIIQFFVCIAYGLIVIALILLMITYRHIIILIEEMKPPQLPSKDLSKPILNKPKEGAIA